MAKAIKKVAKKPVKKVVKKKVVKKTMGMMSKKGRPTKTVKYTKAINVRLTKEQWVQVTTWADKAHLEPSVYIRKVLLDFLNISEKTS